MTAITVNLNPIIQLTDNQFYQLCRENPEVKFERNAKGEILIMSPTGGETGKRNVEVAADFVFWNRQTKLGVCFDSSTCFQLPNGANRSPDVAWIKAHGLVVRSPFCDLLLAVWTFQLSGEFCLHGACEKYILNGNAAA